MELKPEVSRVLVAAPWLKDPNFARTVILLCAHGEEGTLGLVLNRPLEVTLAQGLASDIAPARAAATLYAGGPVASSSLFALHDVARLAEASEAMLEGVRFMAGSDALLALLRETPGQDEMLRLFAGCAGWSPGQLDHEVAENAWILAPGARDVVFDRHPETLWRRVLRSLGPYTAFLATMPEDLRLN